MDERIYGLLGRKLGHSWSVPIHAALGNGAYRLLELEPDGLAPFLHRKDIGGLNVTIPYKRDVMPCAMRSTGGGGHRQRQHHRPVRRRQAGGL